MKKFISIVIFYFTVFGVSAQIEPALLAKTDKIKMNVWVDSVFNAMNEDERIGQLFMVVVDPRSDTKNMQKIQDYIRDSKIGGVLFQKGDPAVQADVTNRMQELSRIPLLIALDGEWGLSMRLSGTTRFPKNMMLGAIEDVSIIEAYGKEVGRQCREMGIHINFAPVIDVNSNVDNPVIGLRSFGEDPDAVAERGVAYARGLEGMGIISFAKHFPGHGDTSEDSHHTLPAVRHSKALLDCVELPPFRKYIHEQFAGVMTGHLYVSALDDSENRAVSMSKPVITDFLKKELGFTGLCITDALAMKGATRNNEQSASVEAFLAGNDIALAPLFLTKEIEAVKKALKNGVLKQSDMQSKCRKILQYKYIAGLNNYRPIELEGLPERLNAPHAAWLAAKLNSEAITLLKNEENCIPVKGLENKKVAVLSVGNPFDNDFLNMLNRYVKAAHYKITTQTNAHEIQQITKELDKFDIIICGVYTMQIKEHAFLRHLAAKKEFIYSFFTLPYFCREYKKSIQASNALVMAYEATPLAQEYAAQVIFGGIASKGKLSVSIPEMYHAGAGEFTKQTRLGYHEPEEVNLNALQLEEIASIVQEGLDQQAYPGCQVLIAKDGMVIFNQSFGYYDYQKKKKVTEYSVYDLASASKATGTLLSVMKAYDEKLIKLGAPVSLYLPVLQYSDKSDLRIEELLFHQSGMPPVIHFYTKAIDKSSYTGSLYSRSRTASHPVRYDAQTYVRNNFKFLPGIISSIRKAGFTTEIARNMYLHDSFKDTIMQEIKNVKLRTRGKYLYSCVNFILLQKIVEGQTGKPMDQLLQHHFFDRLGLQYTTYNPLKKLDSLLIVPTENDQFLRSQLLRGYVHDEAAAFQGGVSGNAGLFSNANDLAKILQLYLNNGRYGGDFFLSEKTCKLFTQSKSPTCRRGLGFDKPDVNDVKKSPCGELATGSVYGHTGYTGTCFWVDPEKNLIFIFLSNRVNPTRANSKLFSLNIRTRIQDVIYKSIKKKELSRF
ncbi:MAG: serine hydrolase [Tannerella sp.]|jgi:beta-glucosidase-like glycosyl hydrolase/CubicO group peptidase (beta-lactamase class C family)|nr:serine hydrolase [Tannerella sp.]